MVESGTGTGDETALGRLSGAELAARVRAGERRALARAITLVESTRPDHRAEAAILLGELAPDAGGAMRIGLSGTPGVGKSTFIEALGMKLVGEGHLVAVLAVDPSSTRSGGSILGDKIRMERLAREPGAFIRSSPSQTTLGGVTRRTGEVILLAEAAGFGVVIVETVGVGQSETMVAGMIDHFVLLMAPAGGDELQGVKRGIMEIADLILVNKADGPLQAVAEATRAEYAAALHLLRKRQRDPEGFPAALTVSAITGAGLDDAWARIAALDAARRESGWLMENRTRQRLARLHAELEAAILARLNALPAFQGRLAVLEARVAAGEIPPEAAARVLVEGFAPKG